MVVKSAKIVLKKMFAFVSIAVEMELRIATSNASSDVGSTRVTGTSSTFLEGRGRGSTGVATPRH